MICRGNKLHMDTSGPSVFYAVSAANQHGPQTDVAPEYFCSRTYTVATLQEALVTRRFSGTLPIRLGTGKPVNARSSRICVILSSCRAHQSSATHGLDEAWVRWKYIWCTRVHRDTRSIASGLSISDERKATRGVGGTKMRRGSSILGTNIVGEPLDSTEVVTRDPLILRSLAKRIG